MEKLRNAKVVRLRSHHGKYLTADEDKESVTQRRHSTSIAVHWTVEFEPEDDDVIRLKSCHGKYLSASDQRFPLRSTHHKVLQSQPWLLHFCVQWEPVEAGDKVALKTPFGRFLWANGGRPPYRNSIAHSLYRRRATWDWILWDVDVVDTIVQSPLSTYLSRSTKFFCFFPQQTGDNRANQGGKGRTIYYQLANEKGVVKKGSEVFRMIFEGDEIEDLKLRIKEVTELEDIVICLRSPLDGNLYPLKFKLPPKNMAMHIILVPVS